MPAIPHEHAPRPGGFHPAVVVLDLSSLLMFVCLLCFAPPAQTAEAPRSAGRGAILISARRNRPVPRAFPERDRLDRVDTVLVINGRGLQDVLDARIWLTDLAQRRGTNLPVHIVVDDDLKPDEIAKLVHLVKSAGFTRWQIRPRDNPR